MKNFSPRRLLMLVRLQIAEIYGRRIWKTLGVFSVVFLVLCILSLLFNRESLAESMDLAEMTIITAAAAQLSVLYNDALSSRIMVPVSNMERYVGVYAGALSVAVCLLLLSMVVGSVFFSIVAFFRGDADIPVLFFLRRGPEVAGLACTLVLMSVFMIWMIPLAYVKKRIGKKVFWIVIIVSAVLIAGPLMLESGGIVPEAAAIAISATVFCLLAIASVVLGYRVMCSFEADSPGKSL